jgi:hypothetical protein
LRDACKILPEPLGVHGKMTHYSSFDIRQS